MYAPIAQTHKQSPQYHWNEQRLILHNLATHLSINPATLLTQQLFPVMPVAPTPYHPLTIYPCQTLKPLD